MPVSFSNPEITSSGNIPAQVKRLSVRSVFESEQAEKDKQIISIAKGYKFYFATLTVSRTAALAGLLDMDPMKIREWRLALKESGEILKQYQSNFDALIKAKEEENKTIGRLIDKAVTLDGIESTEIEIFVK